MFQKILVLAVFLLLVQTVNAENKIEPLPRDLEIQLALSSLPPHLRVS